MTPRGDLTSFIEAFTANQAYVQHDQGRLRFKNAAIEALFDRLRQHQVSILPFGTSECDAWMIVGDDRSKLDIFMRAVSRFIVPTYANFSDGVPLIYPIESSKLLNSGAESFVGYYRLVSPCDQRDVVLQQLQQCFRLLDEADAPVPIRLDRHSYREMYEAFHQTLLAHQWDEAERILETINNNNLATAENLSFLRIEWLARQERWQAIWEHPHYRLLAQIPIPRPIRSALLTAFHYTQLLPHEQEEDWEQLLSVFQQNRPSLASLLNGRFGLTHSAVLRIFAYLGISDADRAMFERVEADTPKQDYQTRFVLSRLESFLPPERPQDTRSTSQKLQEALDISDYETAWKLTDELDDAIQRAASRIQISYLSREGDLSIQALQEYSHLYIENRRYLEDLYPDVQSWVVDITSRVGAEENLIIQTWAEWFTTAETDPQHPTLIGALDVLPTLSTDAFWLQEHIYTLTKHLADVPNADYLQRGIYRQAINQLITICLDDEYFPRVRDDISDLYAFLLQFIARDERNERHTNFVLRLAEGVLASQPSTWEDILRLFIDWFNRPIPALHEGMLDALELLTFYGAQPAYLYSWYREWAESVISTPQVAITDIEVWVSFGEWIHAGEDILRSLHKRIEDRRSTDENRFAALPSRYQIAIFTFDEGAASRARDILMQHNPELDVRICSEKDSNKSVEALAKQADLVVLVATCISHTISYAIKPHAAERLVYPKSRGASSILKSIDEYLRNT